MQRNPIGGLLVLACLLLTAGAGRSAAPPAKSIVRLIDELVTLGGGDGDHSPIVTGRDFLPLAAEKPPVKVLFEKPPVPLRTMREVVKRGAAAVPHLLAHLDDRRRTRIKLGSGGYFGSEYFLERRIDWNPRTAKRPFPFPRPWWVIAPKDTRVVRYHTVTVGDLCFVALGQIVNRHFVAVRGGLIDGSTVITSPTATPSVAKLVREAWEGLTPAGHEASLVADFCKPDYPWRRISACTRLAYYYPATLEPLALKYLADPSHSAFDKALFIRNGLADDPSVKLDRAVRDLLVSIKEDDDLALACMKRLVGRGYDKEIEHYCRRRLAERYVFERDALRRALDRLRYTRLHVAVERGQTDLAAALLKNGAAANAAARNGKTPMQIAVARGDVGLVRVLLDGGAARDRRGPGGLTPAQQAVRAGQDDVVRLLAARGCAIPDVLVASVAGRKDVISAFLKKEPKSVRTTGHAGRTPLHLAARHGHAGVAEVLLSHKAAVDATDAQGRTPLQIASALGHTVVVRVLLTNKANVSAGDAESGGQALHHAVDNNRRAVIELLLAHKADVNAGTTKGWKPLQLAARNGNEWMVKRLVAAGAKLETGESGETTALHEAAIGGNGRVVEFLLGKGAKLDARNYGGCTPLHFAVAYEKVDAVEVLLKHKANTRIYDELGYLPLHLAVEFGRLDLVKLLVEHGADVNAPTGGAKWTPLYLAVESGSAEVVDFLAGKGAKPKVRDHRGRTPLLLAVEKGDLKSARALLRHKADPRTASKSGAQPLHLAVKAGRLDLGKLLLDHGADVNAPRKVSGYTPLHLAIDNEVGRSVAGPVWLDLVNLLLDRKANVNARLKGSGFTPLHLAIECGQPKVVAALLARKPDLSIKDKAGQTPLELAEDSGNPAIIKLIRRHAAKK
jgi:cytohesin